MTRLILCLALALGCGRDLSAQWIASAQEAHLAADAALARGEVEAARSALQAVFESPAPRSVSGADRRAVLQDIAFRLALLELDRGRAAAALEWAERGLRERGRDLFTASLLVARGRALEALGKGGRAAADYHEALLLNEAMLEGEGDHR